MISTEQKNERLLKLAAGDLNLIRISEKIIQRERLSFSEGLTLYHAENREFLRALADYSRKEKCGDTVYYASTLFIHPTNLCELSCPMCSYYAKPGWETAWFFTPKQVMEKIQAVHPRGINEIHVVGGLWRDCNLDYYEELFTSIKAFDPKLHIKALTPVEYDFLAKHHQIPVEEVFKRMMSWGLGSMPGGGAEILVEKIRKQLAPQKITSEEYLEIHKIAHRLGLKGNITMLFGHVEEPEDILTHLIKVREVQDETGGFQTFVPLKYHEENNALGKRKNRLKHKEIRGVYALSRLMLDNIRNLKVLWNYTGVESSLELLQWGGNDLASTAFDEKIITMAGGVQVEMTESTMEKLILSIGRRPQKVHSGSNAQHG